MQDVKIIDIDNVQWNMKDQEARNKTANLENMLQTKANEIKAEIIGEGLRDFRIGDSYFSIPVTVPNGYKCLFALLQWDHPSSLALTISTPYNFTGNKDIYGAYHAFKDSINEKVSIIGLLIKEN